MTASAPAARPAPGTPVTFRWRKWDGSPHWVQECVWLGGDEHGDWLGQRVGAVAERPGRRMVLTAPCVILVPATGDFAATINAEPNPVRVYIDLAWDVRFAGEAEVTGVDMDLDVVRSLDRRLLYVDDRDEWELHRQRYGYPEHVQRHLEPLALELEARVGAEIAPYDDATAERWLARLAELTA